MEDHNTRGEDGKDKEDEVGRGLDGKITCENGQSYGLAGCNIKARE